MKSLTLSIKKQAHPRHDARASRSGLRTFPRTDYHFHAPAEDTAALQERAAATSRDELRAFRQISSDYLGEKRHRGYFIDFAVYGLVTVLCIWALIALGILVFQALNI